METLEQVIETIHQKCDTTDTSRLPEIVKHLVEVKAQKKKLVGLHLKNLIDEDELNTELLALNEQITAIKDGIKQIKTENQAIDITPEDVKKVIKELSQEIKHASPDTLRMVFNKLFWKIKISPKTKKSKYPWSRFLLLKGISIPFTGVKVASPRGFEPLSPA